MSKLRWYRFWVVLILGGLLSGIGWPPAALRIQAAEAPLAAEADLDICGDGEGSGKITGRVTRADDGSPLEGIRVYVTTLYENSYSARANDFTKADGTYELNGLAGGTYVVRADAYTRNSNNTNRPALLEEIYENQPTLATFTPVQVTDGVTVNNINFSLAEGGTIRGRITNQADGTPLQGSVTLHRAASENPFIAFQALNPQANGFYTFTIGLPPGSYKVGYRAISEEMDTVFYPNTTNFELAESLEITGTETKVANLAVTLPSKGEEIPTGQIRGKVTLEGNFNPKEMMMVRAFSENGELPTMLTTLDANGLYTLTVPAGENQVSISPGLGQGEVGPDPRDYVRTFYSGKNTLAEADTIIVPANGVVDNINLTALRGGRISGRVTYAADGTGVAGVTVSAFTGIAPSGLSQSASTLTNAAGFYTLTALANDVYTVTATVDFAERCKYPTQRYQTLVEVNGANPVPNINFAMKPGAYITGRVTISATGAGIAIPVRALLPSEPDFSFGVWTTSAQTGHFRIGPLNPGDYQILFTPSATTGLGRLFYNGATDRAMAQTFMIRADEIINGINGALPPATDEPDPGDPNGPDTESLYLPALER